MLFLQTVKDAVETVRDKAAVQRAVHRSLVVLLAAAVLGTAVYWYTRPAPEVKAAVSFTVHQGDFVIKLTELGELRALESVTISAQKDLPIIELVPEGTFVKAGDVLVRFDATKYEVALEESNAALEIAEAEARKAQQDLEAQRQRLLADIARFELEARIARFDLEELQKKPLPHEREQVQIELEKAQTAFDNAEKKRQLLPAFVEKGFITKSALDEAELRYFETMAALKSAQFNFDKVSAGALPEDLEKARLHLRQSEFALEKAQSGMKSQLQAFEAAVEREKANIKRAKRLIEVAKMTLNRTELEAPKEGIVVYATMKGDKASEKVQLSMIPYQGQPILYLPDLSTIVADTEVNEIDIGKVQVGGPVEVRLEAYPDEVFHGKVLRIGSLAKFKQSRSGTATGIKVFDVTVKIEEKDARLKPGLTATLDFIVERQEDVLSIPLAAVVPQREGHVAFVATNGKVEERKLVLGPSNTHGVIVKSGLRPGEQVLLGAPLHGTP